MSIEFCHVREQNLQIQIFIEIELNKQKQDIQANSIRQLFSITKEWGEYSPT